MKWFPSSLWSYDNLVEEVTTCLYVITYIELLWLRRSIERPLYSTCSRQSSCFGLGWCLTLPAWSLMNRKSVGKECSATVVAWYQAWLIGYHPRLFIQFFSVNTGNFNKQLSRKWMLNMNSYLDVESKPPGFTGVGRLCSGGSLSFSCCHFLIHWGSWISIDLDPNSLPQM